MGKNLTGVAYRIAPGQGTFPTTPTTFASYNISLGIGVTVSAFSVAYANNYVGTPTLVRSGALTLPANDFVDSGNPTPFGLTINFTASYLYTGGNLVFEVRHSGSGGGSNFLDAVSNNAPGFGTLFAGEYTQSHADAIAAQFTNLLTITKFSFAPAAPTVPEPGSVALLAGMGLSGAGFLVLRRKQAHKTA